jgi:hypothetical protein
MRPRAFRTGLCLATTLTLACISPSDPLGREEALQDVQRKYTELIRWGEVERAVRYVDPERHEAFLELAGEFEDLRITDYEVGALDNQGDFNIETDRLPGNGDRATVAISVTYKGYVVSQMIERSFREKQEWYRDSIYNTWLVRPDLDGLLRGIQGIEGTAAAPGGDPVASRR